MQATILHNTERNTIEIRFPAKPTTDVLTGMKALTFRWFGKEAFWYAPYTPDRLAAVQTLLGDEVAADAGYVPRERSERPVGSETTESGKGSLPFMQHLSAYSEFQSLSAIEKKSWENDETAGMNSYDGRTKIVNVFLDSAGNVVLQRIALRWKDFEKAQHGPLEAEEIEKWCKVAKSGKVENLVPGKLKYDGGVPIYAFTKGIYGISIQEANAIRRHKPEDVLNGWYRPAHVDGSPKHLSNGLQVEANKRELLVIGMEVKLWGNGLVFRPTATSTQPQKVVVDSQSDYRPFVLPNRAVVPTQWRKPYYDLSQYDQLNYKNRVKVRSDLVKIEVLLGKMEIAKYKYFDGMQDMYEYTSEDKLAWRTPKNGMPETSYRESPDHTGNNQLTWGSYYLRYNGKSAPAYLTLGTAADLPSDQRSTAAEQVAKGKAAPTKVADPTELAEKFSRLAASYQAVADTKRKELVNAQRNTPKRNKEWNSKNVDADIFADKAMYYKAIGEAIRNGTLPDVLKGITPIRKTDDLYMFVPGVDNSGGYYEAYRAKKPPFQQYSADILKKRANEIGLTFDQVPLAYDALRGLVRGQFNPMDAVLRAMQSHLKAGGAGDNGYAQQTALNRKIDQWRFGKQPGFFPTPTEIGQQMVRAANIKPGNTILEPSAGLGDLAEVIRAQYPRNELSVGETMHSLREILELKGFTLVTENDFLKHKQTYNRIIMNPPYETGQDIDHVLHAHSLLKAGGWLVALMSEGPFYRTDKKATAFRDWLDTQEHYTNPLPEGSFKNAFKSTNVAIRMVMIEKEGIERRSVKATATARKELLRQRTTGKTQAKGGRVVATMQRGSKRAGVMVDKTRNRLLLRARALQLQLVLELELARMKG